MNISKANVECLAYGTACAISDILVGYSVQADVGFCVSQLKSLSKDSYRSELMWSLNGMSIEAKLRGVSDVRFDFSARLHMFFGISYDDLIRVNQAITATDYLAISDLLTNFSILRKAFNRG